MHEPDREALQPEQLAGGEGPRGRWPAAAVAVVLIAGAVLLARAAPHDPRPSASHRETLPPAPAPTSMTTTPAVHVGSVFLEHLLQCTRTDHRHHLTVALGVTNLGAHALLLIGATPVTSDAVLVQPTTVQIGRRGCGAVPASGPVRLPPGGDAVINIAFRVGASCPRHALVSARVSFDGGNAGVLHADSSQLADLDGLDFMQCA